MIAWIKELCRIVKQSKEQEALLTKRVALLEARFRASTSVHYSGGYQGTNTVILVGKYRGQDFIECYNCPSAPFAFTVRQMQSFRRDGIIDVVDAPPELRAFIKRDHF